MNHPTWDQLDACMDHIVAYGQQMRHLDLSREADRARAIEESRRLLGVVLMYRKAVERRAQPDAHPRRRAA